MLLDIVSSSSSFQYYMHFKHFGLPLVLNSILKLLMLYCCSPGNNADIMKVGGYKLSALEIEATILDVSGSIRI